MLNSKITSFVETRSINFSFLKKAAVGAVAFLGANVLLLISLLISGNRDAKQRAKDKERYDKIMTKIKEGKDYTKTDLEWIESILKRQLSNQEYELNDRKEGKDSFVVPTKTWNKNPNPDVESEKHYRTVNNKLNASIQEIKAALKKVQSAKERLGN